MPRRAPKSIAITVIETHLSHGLITSLIAVFLIGALSALGANMSSEFAQIGAAMN